MTRFAHPAPHRDRSLGLGYLPDAGMEAPTPNEASAWCVGAKAGLAFAVELLRQMDGWRLTVEEMVKFIEASHVVPHEASRYGHTYPTALITEGGGEEELTYFAWQIPARGEHDTPEYLRAVELCRLGCPTEAEILGALDGKEPYGSNGNVYRIAEQRRRFRSEAA